MVPALYSLPTKAHREAGECFLHFPFLSFTAGPILCVGKRGRGLVYPGSLPIFLFASYMGISMFSGKTHVVEEVAVR